MSKIPFHDSLQFWRNRAPNQESAAAAWATVRKNHPGHYANLCAFAQNSTKEGRSGDVNGSIMAVTNLALSMPQTANIGVSDVEQMVRDFENDPNNQGGQ